MVLRRRVLVSEVLISQAGQYQAIETLLPETAQRIVGLYAAATPLPGQRYRRRDAFVVFGPAVPATSPAVFGAPITIAGVTTYVGFIVKSGFRMAPSMDAYYTAPPDTYCGFYLPLTDEVPLTNLRVPPGKAVYYAHTVTLGRPRLLDTEGDELAVVYDPNSEKVDSMFSQYTDGTGTVYGDSLIYLCRVVPPAPNSAQSFTNEVSGDYLNGLLFPGDANRF